MPMGRHPAKPLKPPFRNKQWAACFTDFLAQIRAHNPVATTRYHYERYLRRLFLDPAKTPDEYTRQDIEHYIQAPTRRGAIPAARSRNVKLAALRGFYNYALEYDVEYRGKLRPIMNRKPPTHGIRMSKTSTRSRAMSDDELNRFFAAIETEKDCKRRLRDRAIFLALLWSGRRRAALISLYWRDIQQIVMKEQGHETIRWFYSFREKGHVEIDDSAEMPVDAVVAIKAYLEITERWGHIQPHEPLFPGGVPGKPLSASHVNVLFNKYADIAGIKERGVHRLRHTAGRARFELDYNLEAVQKFLRHKSVATTIIYVQSIKHEVDTAAVRLHERFGHL